MGLISLIYEKEGNAQFSQLSRILGWFGTIPLWKRTIPLLLLFLNFSSYLSILGKMPKEGNAQFSKLTRILGWLGTISLWKRTIPFHLLLSLYSWKDTREHDEMTQGVMLGPLENIQWRKHKIELMSVYITVSADPDLYRPSRSGQHLSIHQRRLPVWSVT